ncbi:MAG: hypothetical protein EA426_18190 [Spirochaetaceae bacterium]|nr:MAG: hypothetical protein EA426_18190 [Spirochaetaceae bacterium]
MRLILSLGVILVLGGCDLFGWRVHKAISVKYEESGFSALQTLSNGGSSIQGLYFGELEIVAYHYRPGETIQTGGFASGHGNTDWSHYVVVQSGHPAARDVVLFSNDAIDIDALNADYRQGVSKEYVDNVREFSIDVFEVNLYRNGVIIDNVFYGNNAENNGLETHPLHRYAELNGIPDHYANTRIAGFSRPEQTHNVLFVRSDWFSDPVQVEMSTMGGDSGYEVASSSSPLSEFQEDLLISLAEGGTQRRFYSNFIIVPYGSVRSIDLSRDETITATVRFDFSDAIDYEPGRTDLAAIRDNDWATNPDNQLWFKTDANGVPLGLDVQFE